jgi:WD40 repeat protein
MSLTFAKPLGGARTWFNYAIWLVVILSLAPVTLRTRAAQGQCAGQLEATTQLGRGVLNGISWSPDGTTIAAATSLGVDFIDAVSLTVRDDAHLNASASIHTVAWSPDGHSLAAGGADDLVRLWNAPDTTFWKSLQPPDPEQLTWFYGHPMLNYGTRPDIDRDFSERLGNPQLGVVPPSQGGWAPGIYSVAWSPDGRSLAAASSKGVVQVWDSQGGAPLTSLQANYQSVIDSRSLIAWSHDGHTLVSGGENQLTRWNVASGTVIEVSSDFNASPPRSASPLSVAWSPDGRLIAGGDSSANIDLWDASNGAYLSTLSGHTDRVVSLVWSPDGLTLASASKDGTVRLWNRTGVLLYTLTLPNARQPATSVAWSPDGKTIAASFWWGTLQLWDVATGQPVRSVDLYTAPVTTLSWSSDRRYLAAGYLDGSVRLWNAVTGELIKVLTGGYNRVDVLAWSPDGTTLLVVKNFQIQLWQVSGRRMREVEGRGVAHTAAWSPLGDSFALGANSVGVEFRDVPKGELLAWISSFGPVYDAAWSPDGVRIALSTGDSFHIFDMNLRKPLTEFNHSITSSLAVTWREASHPLEARVVQDREIWIFDGIRESLLARFPFWGGTHFLAWSPSARRLAATMENWLYDINAATGETIASAQTPGDYINSVVWSPDDRQIATGSPDGAIRIWHCRG